MTHWSPLPSTTDTVFVVKSVQDRASDDLKLAGRTGAGGVAKAGRQNADQEDRTQGQIGPGSVVVGHPRYQDSPQVPFAQWNDAVQTLPPQGSDKPFAKRVRLGLRTGAVITVPRQHKLDSLGRLSKRGFLAHL